MEAEDNVAERARTDHCLALLSNMSELFFKNELSDVTLQIENLSFKSHRFVLAASSKYFHRMFGGNFKEKNLDNEGPIILYNIDSEAFELILHFMYFGDAIITISDVYPVLVTADFLELKTPYIETKCIESIQKNIQGPEPIPNAMKIFKFSCATKKEALTDLLRKHIFQHLCQLSTEDTFESFSYEDLKELLQGYPLWMNDQDTVLTFIIGWVHQSHKERKHFLNELIKLPDLKKISSNCLVFLLNEYEKLIDRLEEEPGRTDDVGFKFESLPSPSCLIDNGKFELSMTFAKDNFLALKQSETWLSPQYVKQDLSWRIMIFREAEHLGVFLQCGGHPENKHWKCLVNRIDLSILWKKGKDEGSTLRHFSKDSSGHGQEFNEKEKDRGWSKFILWNDVINPENGYIKDNVVIFQAYMIIDSPPDM